jgi:dihydroxy-acid dehydratase
MLPGSYEGKEILMPDVDAAVLGMYPTGRISDQDLSAWERAACPTCGACPVLGTANSMQIITEALGMCLPGSSTIPAVYGERLSSARESGRRIVELVRSDLKPSQILTEGAFDNAIRVDLAIGGSTNVPLHLIAIARAIGLDLKLDRFDELSRVTPCICAVRPNGPYNVVDLHNAGGVMAVMSQLRDQLDLDALTVSGRTLRESVDEASCRNRDVVRPLSAPVFKEGGLAVLKGTLAPNGAIVRQSAVVKDRLCVKGPAVVFDTDEDSYDGIRHGRIRDGDIIIIRYEGPRGAPGMREVMLSTESITGMGLDAKVSLVTDGRFSGFSRGLIVGHASPEAALGGPIAVVKNNDIVLIDIPRRRLDLDVPDEEIRERLARWSPPERTIKSGFLSLYATTAEPAELGASMRV